MAQPTDDPRRQALVAGEPVDVLVAALLQCKPRLLNDGCWRIDTMLDAPTGTPLARALMRTEAELLAQDADDLRPDHLVPERTPEQRRADAFMALVRRVRGAIVD
jgi:hypothetical protein